MPARHSPTTPLMNWPLHRAITMKREERDRLAERLKRKAPRSDQAVELRAALRMATRELLELETKLRNDQ